MHIANVGCEAREVAGRHANERLRRRGMIPAIIYGHGEKPESVAINQHDLEMALRDLQHVVKLKVNTKEDNYLIKDVQYDHLQRTPLHADFMRVDASEKVHVKVGIELRGVPVGVGLGGEMVHPFSDIDIECFLMQIPESIKVKIDHMNIGDTIRIKDLELPDGVKILKHLPDDIVVSVRHKKAEEVAAVAVPGAEGDAAKEPEVLARGKKEEEAIPEAK